MNYDSLPEWLRSGLSAAGQFGAQMANPESWNRAATDIGLSQTSWEPGQEELRKRLQERSLGMGGATMGITKLIPGQGVNIIKALDNATGREVGQLGYRQMPGRGGRLLDIKVDPSVRGQGYGRELVDRFEQEMGPNMKDAGFAGTISNSPGFWEHLTKRWEGLPISQGIRQSLDWLK